MLPFLLLPKEAVICVCSGYQILFSTYFGLILNVGFNTNQIVSELEGMICHIIGLIYCKYMLSCDPYILTNILLNPQFRLLYLIFGCLLCLLVE
jgi:hypothetical protein